MLCFVQEHKKEKQFKVKKKNASCPVHAITAHGGAEYSTMHS
jgi:hypothetical protein